MAKQKAERIDLLKNAIALLRAQGYHNTSMADIARVCSMSKAGLYHHFTSKLDLVATALTWLSKDFSERVLSHIDDLATAPRQRFVSMLIAVERYSLNEEHGASCVMANIALETSGTVPEFAKIIKHFLRSRLVMQVHAEVEIIALGNFVHTT